MAIQIDLSLLSYIFVWDVKFLFSHLTAIKTILQLLGKKMNIVILWLDFENGFSVITFV